MFDESEIAKSSGQKDVGFGAACDKKASDFGMIADEVLRRSGFVVDVFGVDLSAVIEEEFGDFDIPREMEGMFAVAATGRDERWISGDERAEVIHPAQASGLMDADSGATTDSVVGEVFVGAIEKAKAASPPLAFGVDIGALFEKEIDHFF